MERGTWLFSLSRFNSVFNFPLPPWKGQPGGEKGKEGDGFGEGKRGRALVSLEVERGVRNEEGRQVVSIVKRVQVL